MIKAKDIIEIVFPILYFVAVYLERKRLAQKKGNIYRPREIKWIVLTVVIFAAIPLYFLIFQESRKGFDLTILILQFIVYISIAIYFFINISGTFLYKKYEK